MSKKKPEVNANTFVKSYWNIVYSSAVILKDALFQGECFSPLYSLLCSSIFETIATSSCVVIQ